MNYGYRLTANETKTCSIDQCSIFLEIAKAIFFICVIKQLLPLCEGNMTILSLSTRNIVLGLRLLAILPAWGEEIIILPSHKGNNYIIYQSFHHHRD